MNEYFILAVGMILLPGIYICLMIWQAGKIERLSCLERGVLIMAAVSFFRIWQKNINGETTCLFMIMEYVMLSFMTYFCVEDYREKLVPNRVLLLLLAVFPILLGGYGIHDMETVWKSIPAIVLGFLFSLLSFGLGYLMSHGNVGAGDVKLALIMGIYLTGNEIPGTILYGCLIAAGYSIIQLLRKKISRKDRLPFVPFLYMGLVVRCIL